MISDMQLLDWAARSYTEPATVETADAHCLIGIEDEVQVLALRGTDDPRDLIDLWRDVGAAEVRDDPILGKTSASFLADAEQLVWRVRGILQPGYALTGHKQGRG